MSATRPKSEAKVFGMVINLKASPLGNSMLKEASKNFEVNEW